jgi:hypothetical protein
MKKAAEVRLVAALLGMPIPALDFASAGLG